MIGLNVSQYLYGVSISNMILIMILAVLFFLKLRHDYHKILVAVKTISLITIVFNTCWIIVGGIVLFRNNMTCINDRVLNFAYSPLVSLC